MQAQIEEIDTSKSDQLSTQLQLQDNVPYFGDRFSDADEIYINNSGLILLWPFYKRLFEKIGLVQHNSFVNSNAVQKAVFILQYLVDGAIETPEHILPLNKLKLQVT